jgi:hypothetical protein
VVRTDNIEILGLHLGNRRVSLKEVQ